ncbi:MAG: discoidin domain-containing protein [Firmicutes bacterium]|nr:discoidin domain-containing protein [Bacillota bacterium]
MHIFEKIALITFCFIFFAFTAKTFAAGLSEPVAATNFPAKEDFHIYLCIGQSNMAGRAAVEKVDQKRFDNVYLFNGNEWEYAQPWYRKNNLEGFNRYANVLFNENKLQGLSPAFYFADVMERNAPDNVKIGIVSNAKGGTAISQWMKGYANPPGTRDDFDLFENTVLYAKDAMQRGTLRGIIWHQGESDKNNSNYINDLKTFVTDLRSELGVGAEVPFIAGEIGHFVSSASNFNNRLPTMLGENGIINSHYIEVPPSCGHIGDNLHFNSEAQRTIGALYGNKALSVIYGIDVEPDEPDDTPPQESDKIILDNEKITASNTNSTHYPRNVNDGLKGDQNRWLGVFTPEIAPAHLTVDLGAIKHVDSVNIYFYKPSDITWVQQYKVQVATAEKGDEGDFVDLFSGTRESNARSNHDGSHYYETVEVNRPIRLLRIVITDSTKIHKDGLPKKYACLYEVDFFGDNTPIADRTVKVGINRYIQNGVELDGPAKGLVTGKIKFINNGPQQKYTYVVGVYDDDNALQAIDISAAIVKEGETKEMTANVNVENANWVVKAFLLDDLKSLKPQLKLNSLI